MGVKQETEWIDGLLTVCCPSLSVLCVSFVSIATHTLYPPCIAALSGCRCRHIRQYAPSITDHVSVLSLCALHVPSVQAILMIYCYCSLCYCSLCYWCSVCLLLYTHRLYSPCIGALFLTQPCSILVPSLASSWSIPEILQHCDRARAAAVRQAKARRRQSQRSRNTLRSRCG